MIDPLLAPLVELVKWFLGLFAPAEWRAMAWLVFATMAATHTAKVAMRLRERATPAAIYLASAAIALGIAWLIWPAASVPWYVAGTVGGPAANLAFFILFAILKRISPDTARRVNFDRPPPLAPCPPAKKRRRKMRARR